jgi:hypothetical protein
LTSNTSLENIGDLANRTNSEKDMTPPNQRFTAYFLGVASLLTAPDAHARQAFSAGEGEGQIEFVQASDLAANSDDIRFSWDYSLRSVHAAGVERTGLLSAVGADLYYVIPSADLRGDLGTLRLQGYALRADGLPATPGFFDDAHDWEWTYRIFDFNYTRFASKGVNIRMGHFEVPYGLEQTQATNGTLQQYMSGINLGMKVDWGVSLNGQLADYEYEVSLSRGSGRLYEDLDENYLMSGRLPAGGFARRERFGVDAVWTLPAATVLSELNFGKNGDTNVASGLLEVNVTNSDERELAYVQLIGTDTEGDDKYWATIGTRLYTGNGVTLSTQWKVDLDANEGMHPSEAFMVQLRYRF